MKLTINNDAAYLDQRWTAAVFIPNTYRWSDKTARPCAFYTCWLIHHDEPNTYSVMIEGLNGEHRRFYGPYKNHSTATRTAERLMEG